MDKLLVEDDSAFPTAIRTGTSITLQSRDKNTQSLLKPIAVDVIEGLSALGTFVA